MPKLITKLHSSVVETETTVAEQGVNTADKKIARRHLLKMLGVGSTLMLWQNPVSAAISATLKNTQASSHVSPKIVWVVLRGALDSLHTIVPTFDKEFSVLRPTLSQSFKEDLLPLDRGFALHPALKNMHQWYQSKKLLPVVAVSSGYNARSHFDGQDFLESGKPTIDFESGWLARAIDQKDKNALAVARSIPVSLRSSSKVQSWYPSKLKSSTEELLSGLMSLYQEDEVLLERLQDGLTIRDMAGENGKAIKKSNFTDLTKACAQLMKGEKGVDCAMLELGGWDTHNNQARRLEKQLAELDQGLAILKQGLADEWKNTVVIVATEFGRTAKENGTGGTDHGTASALFLAGGAIAGGKVLGDWPGLKTEQLYQQRDLAPTSNSFEWIATLLQQHWKLDDHSLARIFPNINSKNIALLG